MVGKRECSNYRINRRQDCGERPVGGEGEVGDFEIEAGEMISAWRFSW
jgi:hypothetical protein